MAKNNDDDDEYIDFRISNADLEFEQYGFNRNAKRMSKNQAIYGIWAESESDDDAEGNDKHNKKRKDYTSGVSFVKSDNKLNDEVKELKSSTLKNDSSKKKKQQPSRFSGLGSTFNNPMDSEFGQWEMYTKGVGSKLLQKMGYQPGKGLGKNLQGIIEPIEAKKRPGTGSIGLYGPETTAKTLRRGDDKDEKNEDKNKETSALKKNEQNWKRKEKIPTIKVCEKSADDFIHESIKKSWTTDQSDDYLNGVKIIDMTGPQQQVLSGLTKLHQSKAEKPKDNYDVTEYNSKFDMPELRMNIERHMKMTERKIIKRSRDYNQNKNQIENLKTERDSVKQSIAEYDDELKTLVAIEEFFESIDDIKTELTFEKALEMHEKFLAELKPNKINGDENSNTRLILRTIKFDSSIEQIFGSVLSRELRNKWRPFNDQSSIDYSSHFERLRSLVMKNKTYEKILWQHWYPQIVRSLLSIELKSQYESMILFIQKWHPLLPKWLYNYFLASNLLPKLHAEVNEWDPLTDTVSIHSWIHPWLSVLMIDENDLNTLFEPIYCTIRTKLSNALKNWHPSDCSARLILEPWRNVFSESSMQTFLEINIVPKLEQAMQQMQINPNQQSFNEWTWTMQWLSLLSLNSIVSILERTFFSKWLNVLYVWLNSNTKNFQEIRNWYQGWKTIMGNELINHSLVKEFLRKALIMMDHAVNLETGLKSFHSYYDANNFGIKQQQPPTLIKPPIPPSPPPAPPAQEDKMNFRQMIEMKAAECGIIFMPLANRFENGHQIFKFGDCLIYIDNQVIFQNRYQNGHRIWAPVSLSDLLKNG